MTDPKDEGFSIQELVDSGVIEFGESTTLNLKGLKIKSLDGLQNVPNPENIDFLDLSENKLTVLAPRAFERFPNLKTLRLSANGTLTEICPEAFFGLSKLLRLYLSRTDFKKIDKNTFKGLCSLESLELQNGQISEIGPGSFIELSHLVELDLAGNSIADLPENTWQGLGKVENLNLGYNRLTSLRLGAFKGLKNLASLSLRRNQLSQIEERAFRDLVNLYDVDLSENPFDERPDWLADLQKVQNLQRLQLVARTSLPPKDHQKAKKVADKKLSYMTNPGCTLTEEEVKEAFESSVDEGYLIKTTPSEGMEQVTTKSKFGGQPYDEGEAWPTCTHCDEPLTFVFQFNTEGLRPLKNLETTCLYVFFFCNTDSCCCAGRGTNEDDGTWILRKYASPSIEKARKVVSPAPPDDDEYAVRIVPCAIEAIYEKTFPYASKLDSGSKAIIEFMTGKTEDDEEFELMVEEIATNLFSCGLENTGGKGYLGLPYFFNPLEIPVCSKCNNAMELLFQLGSDESSGFEYGDCGCVYLFFCPKHQDEFGFRALA
jgi:uncharacterized protein YwqG